MSQRARGRKPAVQPATTGAAQPPRRNVTGPTTSMYFRAFAFFILAAAILLFVVVRLGSGESHPGTDSAEAGFARDMKTHHAQAVEMAFIVRDRLTGSDTDLHYFLTDMIQTQTNQMGQMEGWLNVWGVPLGSVQKPMAWMGHEVDGLMPGMATDEQIAQLRTLPEREMVISFMQLMIAHHQSAVEMANAILDRSDIDVVRRLATSIVQTQQAEIALMNSYLEQYQAMPPSSPDAEQPSASPVASPMAGMDH